MELEIVATRKGDEGIEYLVVFQSQAYIVDSQGAMRVALSRALGSDEWGGDVPSTTFELSDKLVGAIRELHSEELAREGRLISSKM